MPYELQRRIVCAIRDAYTEALRVIVDCGFEAEEKHDLLPYLKRSIVERNLRNLGKYPGVRVDTRMNVARNCFHNVIYCGNVMMTASYVDAPRRKVREAEYRRSYIEQLNLFEDLREGEILGDANYYYAIIVHGGIEHLDFVGVAFPTRDYSAYECYIDVLNRFPDLGFGIDSDIEKIDEDLIVNLKILQEKKERA